MENHAKTIGLVKAVVKVNEMLDASLLSSLFQPGARYNAWVRFTNASRNIQADKKKDVRAMAIKIENATGAQDLILFTEKIQTPNILEELFWSNTPYRYGQRMVKWHARPLKLVTDLMPREASENYLRERLIKDLIRQDREKEEIAFALSVQFEGARPFHEVATIVLPQQDIERKDLLQLDIDMNFSPGYALLKHAPVN